PICPCEGSDRDPVARCLRRNADDVREQVAQIGTSPDRLTPCCEQGELSAADELCDVSLVLCLESRRVHVVQALRVGRPLWIYVEHHPAVEPVPLRVPLHSPHRLVEHAGYRG